MRVFRGFSGAGNFRNPVVTTGSFDGVHTGHKAIINRLKNLAVIHQGETVLITFHPHPRKILYPETEGKNLKLITTLEEKLHLLEKAGLDNVIVAEFTREFAKTSGEQFIKEYLTGCIGAKVVVVGFNHHFGWQKQGDFKYLSRLGRKYGFDAEEIPQEVVEHEAVSSTRIRKALAEGYIQRANAYLDNYYMIMSESVTSDEFADTGYRFCRVNLSNLVDKLVPPPGLYAISIDNLIERVKGLAMISLDERGEERVYFHPFDEDKDFCNKKIRLLFHKRMGEDPEKHDGKKLKFSLDRTIDMINDLIY